MRLRDHEQSGFTLVEILVAMSLFAVLSIGFYSVMLAGVRNSDATEAIVNISEEARFGFNRMVRDTREALRISDVTMGPGASVSYTVEIDFDFDGDIEPAAGEVETFAYDEAAETITLNGETLVAGVTPVAGTEVFDFSSNLLQFEDDATRDGVATWQEIDTPPPARTDGGNADGVLNGAEFPYLTNVTFAFQVTSGDRTTEFYSEAQLRNLRIEREA